MSDLFPSYDGAEGLRVEQDGGVLHLVLDRPEKRNALTDAMIQGLISAFLAAGSDESVRAVLLRAEGDHFCSGFDIVGRNAGGERPRVGSIQRRLPWQAHRLIPTMMTVQTPIVCSAQGWIAGIGLHMALASDFAVVDEGARLWEPFSSRGFAPDSGATWLLPRRIGEVRAREMLILGREVDGREAAEWGLVHRAVPAGELAAETAGVVGKLAEGATVTLGLTKWLMYSGATTPLDRHHHEEAVAMELSSRSDDFKEGLKAFVEKRPPRFTGR